MATNNGNGMMLSRTTGEAVQWNGIGGPGPVQVPGYANGAGMLRRDDIGTAAASVQDAGEKTIPDIPEPDMEPAPAPAPAQAAQPKPAPAAPAAGQAPRQDAKPAPAPAPAAAVPKQAPAAQAPKAIRQARTPDDLCQAYMTMFRESLGLDLSPSICFENMRRMCEPDVRDPLKTLYFLENTYRLSTLLYLSRNLPVLFVTSVLAEKNRKNILKYVSIEVENGSKPYDELVQLRRRRWARKYENMAVNDAITVTPGATMPSPELAAKMKAALADTCAKLRRFNGEMTSIAAKFDDGARNDVTYIYSNWWYMLQGFENVPEMRSYVMAVTDDTRRNLKI